MSEFIPPNAEQIKPDLIYELALLEIKDRVHGCSFPSALRKDYRLDLSLVKSEKNPTTETPTVKVWALHRRA